MTPTARTLKYYRELGCPAQVVERWNPFSKTRQDLFGFIDILVLQDKKLLGIQATSGAHHADHKDKILNSKYLLDWLNSGAKLFLITWSKLKLHRGSKAIRWTMRLEEITLESIRENSCNIQHM